MRWWVRQIKILVDFVTPTMDEATYQTMVATAKSQGYDVSKLQKPYK